MNSKTLFCLSLIIALVSALECNVDQSTYPQSVKVGNSFVICIHFKNKNGTSQRAVFPIIVDKYTALSLSNAYSLIQPSLVAENSLITIQIQNSNITRETVFYNNNIQQVAKMMSFIIYANRGAVEVIQDDNSPFCEACNATCAPYTTGPDNTESYKNCYKIPSETASDNDPKIFISWMGTDSEGSYLLSQTHRISRFTEYGTNNVFESALGLFQKL